MELCLWCFKVAHLNRSLYGLTSKRSGRGAIISLRAHDEESGFLAQCVGDALVFRLVEDTFVSVILLLLAWTVFSQEDARRVGVTVPAREGLNRLDPINDLDTLLQQSHALPWWSTDTSRNDNAVERPPPHEMQAGWGRDNDLSFA